MPTRKQIADYLNKLERAQFRGETSYANKVQREKNRLTRYLSEYYSENGVLNDNDAEIYAHAENLIELEEQVYTDRAYNYWCFFSFKLSE
jgi:hypothetical protein